ncbi:tetratricopeptide repeat protein [Oscillatoria sp. CS-180]|uniref:serine/threonine-protein kinase n=1 Tax=Oscillatoria sp. CS-180 TaxID=3021720 RepID=UPI0023312A53|nr:serine/threonine-protein kinase [Oscillatoria sp. CS-180]MDB9525136.1 tetratricopeptide repeat protein [Oscillatoria sp. CS-180]
MVADGIQGGNQASSYILGSRYHILQHLGGGGFGQTFLAQDLHLPGHPRCVVKRLQPRTSDSEQLESARRLFHAEAEALYVLGNHDQIPRLLAHFEEDQQFYLAQEFIEGSLLSEEIRASHHLAETQTVEIIQDILTTLCTVHDNHVIHRDIKPSNLIRRQSDRKIVLIDFGAVKQVSTQPVQQQGQMSMTVAIGSLGYMPNEQLAGHPCLSSDIYAVGILALQALTGLDPKRIPKEPRTSELMWHELASVKPELSKVLDTMVRYDHRQRYPSAHEALTALKQAVGPSIPIFIPQIDLSSQALEAHVAWLERADELFEQSRFREAARCYEKVVKVQPHAMTAWFKLGMALENIEEYALAVTAYKIVTQRQPEDYLAWLKLGKALEQLEKLDDALTAYDEVLKLQPKNYWAWADRGELLERLERIDEALSSYDRAIELKPDFALAQENRKQLLILLRRVDQLYTLQHYDDAIEACDQALKEAPQDATLWLMRGMALENQKQLAEAAIAYNTVVSLQSDDHVAWFRLGTVLEDLGHSKRAAKAYGNVTRLQPQNHWAWYQLGRVAELLEDYREAISSYQQAVKLQANFQLAQEAYERLINQSLPTALP